MNLRSLGLALIGLALLFAAVLWVFKLQVNSLVESQMVLSGGECIIGGECMHEQSNTPMYLGLAGTFALFFSGIYLFSLERSQRDLHMQHEQIVQRLEETKRHSETDEKFQMLLKGLSEEEQKVVTAVREQDGITQATLRIRTDLSKTKLSLVLKDLEKKALVQRTQDGKTNKVFLKMAF